MNKILQITATVIALVSLALRIYQDYSDKVYIDKNLVQGILGLSLATSFHFMMVGLKESKPEKYQKTMHWILVGSWGLVGLINLLEAIFMG
jgi:L-cystine uptake protein TcyP (sodium:dicarboxylate symporter family)